MVTAQARICPGSFWPDLCALKWLAAASAAMTFFQAALQGVLRRRYEMQKHWAGSFATFVWLLVGAYLFWAPHSPFPFLAGSAYFIPHAPGGSGTVGLPPT